MVIRKIQPDEIKECEKVARVAFEGNADLSRSPQEHRAYVAANPKSREQAYYQEKWAAYTHDGAMMACLSALPYQIYFDGSVQSMLGIAGVCTYPQHRRKGAVRSCMQEMLRDAYGRGVGFSYLHAFSEAFYAAFGYTPSCHSNQWRLALDGLSKVDYDGSFTLYTNETEIPDFAAAYERFAEKFNLMVRRDGDDWYFLKSADPYAGHRYAYLYRDKDNVPRGYLLFHKEQWEGRPLMQVEEMVYDDRATLQILLSFVRTFRANYHFIRFKAPRLFALHSLGGDFALFGNECHVVLNGMVRVVHVETVLRHAKYQGDGLVRIEIMDPVIKENDTVFTVQFQKGQCVSVQRTPDEKPDVRLSVNAFSALITGSLGLDDCFWMEPQQAQILNNQEGLHKVFYQKNCWISDSF